MGEFLNNITLDFIEPYTTEMKRIKFFTDFDGDISELFPYLNVKL